MTIGVRVGVVVGVAAGPAAGVSESEIGGSPATLFGMLGNSNTYGFALFGGATGADPAFNVGTPRVSRYNWHGSAGVADPPVFAAAFPGPGDLDVGGVAARVAADGKMGLEIGIAAALETRIPVPALASMGLVSATLAVHWLPGTPYPSSGPDLFLLWVARMHALEAVLGRQLGGAIIDLLSNDTASAPQSAAAGTNIATLTAAIRAIWPGLPIVMPKLSISNLNAANRDTIRALEVTYAAGDSRFALVDNDDLPLTDGLHWPAQAYLALGDRCGYALMDLLGLARRTVTTPTVIGWGPGAFGATDLSFANANAVYSSAAAQNGHLELMIVETGVVSGSAIATPAGWTAVGTLQTTGSGGVFCNVQLFSRPVTTAILNANGGHMPATSYTAADNRNVAKIITIIGPNANPTIDVATPFVANALGASMSVPAITTTANNELVLVIAGGWAGSSSRSQAITNGTLSNFTQHQDGAYPMPTTDALVLTFASGVKATAGSTGTSTVTVTGGSTIGWAFTIGIKP
jgi:hypothetical protein